MSIDVRPVDVHVDACRLLDVLERNLGVPRNPARLDWLYRRNPCGPAWVWGAYEAGTDQLLGSASVFPRAICIGGRVELGGQIGLFAVDGRHRTLGPALALQRATFEPVAKGTVVMCYDCPPHDQGMATLTRLGLQQSSEMYRFVRPLRVDSRVARVLGPGFSTTWLTALLNGALRVSACRIERGAGAEIHAPAGPFREELTPLDPAVRGP